MPFRLFAAKRHYAKRFRLFATRVFSSFRLFAWRFFVISCFCMASFRLFAWRLCAAKRQNGIIQPPYFVYLSVLLGVLSLELP